ncbi:MAG: pyridoxamine 5'-phosphate oxidase family protein [Tabrizicola sp.]|uniref:pyridoxamine 5'-phosphate oxidase family protein n=1 Tax=Tabrizicola sp. TaxID=2005166 RepID=UPI00273387D2|nr:pyridoxamine 5'-phosphate oxidase family protein [Tabrizicola sp.]MDP3264878.1 pyridoxamine 5'-phosphate oxidase family protein [Tabrizicola sp.]MDP3647613.1 pyridoxamine 5'-phosphate oxidase family protein [Paracoccaceae bacterium]MDZ4069742.1 pyridoxamine 5'-phosphate oxidase family protein [Tabrizicola sp.]
MTKRPDPVAPADAEARSLARTLMQAGHAALAYTDAATGTPGISRIAFGLGPDGTMLTLISALAAHHAGLAAHPACALMLGEPEGKGDPLTHPRLMIRATARFIAPDAPDRPTIRDHWLGRHPKAKLYIDFADFAFVRFQPVSALLNAGFARAYRLTPGDLA